MASEQGQAGRTREERLNLQERSGVDEVRRWNSGWRDWIRRISREQD